MALNNLPSSIQSVIQQGFLERQFRQALRAKLGFRAIADKEPFMAGIGETITKTRVGLLPAITTPMAPASNSDFTSGLAAQNYSVEQYALAVAQYPGVMQLNLATAKVAIDDLYLQNAYALGEQASRSVDTLAQRALYDAYMGGNTRVTTTLGSAGTTVHVDDVRGFFMTLNSQGQPVAVSSANTLAVQVGSNTYSLTAVVADGSAPTTINPWLSNLSFSGSSSNSSTAPNGYSGTLTFSGNVTVADATAGNAAVSAVAPVVMRPSVLSTGVMAATTLAIASATDINNARLTMQMILTAKANLSANGVPVVADRGNYVLYSDPIQLTGLFQDPAFQMFFRGKPDSKEYKKGLVAELLECEIVETNLNPVQVLSGVGTVHRAVLCGQGALVEGEFTGTSYLDAERADDAEGMITVVDGIAHITREPLDALKQVITQSWSYIGGFAVPTDTTTNPNTIPTATNAALKRAAILESL
ncbi:MAG: DUF4043 domain-containing protein [Acetobacteraceae bacterium]|nr:DUF4043 domain-containing protein [Acetobacteraceae bacterium]